MVTPIQSRTTVLAVMVETTEGTPISPTAVTDYVALQEDATATADFEDLDNDEIKSSLAPSKVIQGIETPGFSFSHYLNHSGTVAQAPEENELLKAAWGTEAIRATERDTVAGSTTSVINVDTGEGAEFQLGDLLLIKDSTNGFSLRPVQSVATDALTLGFNLDNAPATGVNLGRNVVYRPANSGHQSLSLWHFLGNGGATELISGSRVTNVTIDFTAGQLINAAYTTEGLKYHFDPIEITATDIFIDWTDDGGTFAASVTAQFFRDPHDLASSLATAMNAQTAETITVTYSDTTGKYTIAATGAVFSLLWSTGANTANTIGDQIGFTVSADDTGATTYTSDNAISFAAPQTPTFDGADPLVAKANKVFIGDATDNICFEASVVSANMDLVRRPIDSICADSGRSSSFISERNTEITVTGVLKKFEADRFNRFANNTTTRFLYNFGSKTAGDWDEAKSGCLYAPVCTISDHDINGNDDGLVSVSMTIRPFANSTGDGEYFLNFI